MDAKEGRPPIAPKKLLRAQLLRMPYSIRSELLLMEEIDYSILFRWFVGLNLDLEVWDTAVFTKNRDRLLEAEVAKEFLAQAVEQAHLAVREAFTFAWEQTLQETTPTPLGLTSYSNASLNSGVTAKQYNMTSVLT